MDGQQYFSLSGRWEGDNERLCAVEQVSQYKHPKTYAVPVCHKLVA